PVFRPGEALVLVSNLRGVQRFKKRRFVFNRAALFREDSGDPALERPFFKIMVRLLWRQSLDSAFDAHLPPNVRPIEHNGGERILRQFATLAAFIVGEK